MWTEWLEQKSRSLLSKGISPEFFCNWLYSRKVLYFSDISGLFVINEWHLRNI